MTAGPRPAAPIAAPTAVNPGVTTGSTDRTGLLLLAVAVVSVGAAAVLIRLAAAPPLTAAFFRLACGAGVLGAAVALRRRPSAERTATVHVRRVVVAGVLLALHFALWIASLERTTVTASVVLVCLQPVFVAVIAWLALRERTPPRALAGIVVALVGAVAVASDGAGGPPAAGARGTLVGDVLALAGAVAIAGYVLVLRSQRGDVLVTSAWVTTTAAAVLLPACLVAGAPLTPVSTTQAGWLLALALGPQVIGHTALNAALQRLPASMVSGSILGEPVIASGLAWLLLDERPGWRTAAGSVVTLAGVALLLRAPTSGQPQEAERATTQT